MMSKVKEWATDLAEVYLDELANDIDTKKITLQEGIDQAVQSNVNFGYFNEAPFVPPDVSPL